LGTTFQLLILISNRPSTRCHACDIGHLWHNFLAVCGQETQAMLETYALGLCILGILVVKSHSIRMTAANNELTMKDIL
jgi:hypothetical protein